MPYIDRLDAERTIEVDSDGDLAFELAGWDGRNETWYIYLTDNDKRKLAIDLLASIGESA